MAVKSKSCGPETGEINKGLSNVVLLPLKNLPAALIHLATPPLIGLLLLPSVLVAPACKAPRTVPPAVFQTYKSHYFPVDEIKRLYDDCFSGGHDCEKASVAFSFIGETTQANAAWDRQGRSMYVHPTDTTIAVKNYTLINAEKFIDSVAQNYRVVMLNEAHQRPESRVYSADLVKLLRKKGFNYLGIEGLQETGDSIHHRGFPSVNSGYYLREPQYANLIRIALRSGYRLFAYDRSSGSGKQRELHQASEIYRVIQQDPQARILVHAGWGHIREDTAILGGLMAYEFKRLSAIDPLTISQTRYIPQSDQAYENPLYVKIKQIDAPGILVRKNDLALYQDGLTDISLFQPRTGLEFFMQHSFLHRTARVRIAQPGLLLAIPSDENLHQYPVPAFIKEVRAGKRPVKFLMPLPGVYTLYLLTPENMFLLRKLKIN